MRTRILFDPEVPTKSVFCDVPSTTEAYWVVFSCTELRDVVQVLRLESRKAVSSPMDYAMRRVVLLFELWYLLVLENLTT